MLQLVYGYPVESTKGIVSVTTTPEVKSSPWPTYREKELSTAAKCGLIATGFFVLIISLFGVIYCRRAKLYASNRPAYYNDIRMNRPIGIGNNEYDDESDCEPLFDDHLIIG